MVKGLLFHTNYHYFDISNDYCYDTPYKLQCQHKVRIYFKLGQFYCLSYKIPEQIYHRA